jgi:hypothetical protein
MSEKGFKHKRGSISINVASDYTRLMDNNAVASARLLTANPKYITIEFRNRRKVPLKNTSKILKDSSYKGYGGKGLIVPNNTATNPYLRNPI